MTNRAVDQWRRRAALVVNAWPFSCVRGGACGGMRGMRERRGGFASPSAADESIRRDRAIARLLHHGCLRKTAIYAPRCRPSRSLQRTICVRGRSGTGPASAPQWHPRYRTAPRSLAHLMKRRLHFLSQEAGQHRGLCPTKARACHLELAQPRRFIARSLLLTALPVTPCCLLPHPGEHAISASRVIA